MANYTVINVKEFWTNKDFLDFSVKRFSRGLNEGHEVVLIGLELADRSLACSWLTGIRQAAEAPSGASIQSPPFFIFSKKIKEYETYH